MIIHRHQFTDLTEAEIVKAMGPYSYGKGFERTTQALVYTLAHGLLQISAGFRTGGTLTMVLRDMGMITTKRGYVTVKGRMFMYDCFNGSQTDYVPKSKPQQPPPNGPLPQPGGNTGKPCQVNTP